METEVVAQLIRAGLPGAEVQVTGDGAHFEAIPGLKDEGGWEFMKRKGVCAHLRPGQFREDLYYRVRVLEITIPPASTHRKHPVVDRALYRRTRGTLSG